MVDFLFVIIERFSLALTVKTLSAEICQHWSFSKGWVKVEGDVSHSPTDPSWC